MTDPAHTVLDKCRHLLTDDLRAIELCLERVSDDDFWWRPNEASNGIGHLLQHLNGNLAEWIIGGVDGRPFVRDRATEFVTGPATRSDVWLALQATVDDVNGVFARLDESALVAKRTIRGLDVSVLEAILHVVHHFGEHTGQIILLTKLRTGTDLGLMGRRSLVVPRDPGGME